MYMKDWVVYNFILAHGKISFTLLVLMVVEWFENVIEKCGCYIFFPSKCGDILGC